jgi:hypothetical protein
MRFMTYLVYAIQSPNPTGINLSWAVSHLMPVRFMVSWTVQPFRISLRVSVIQYLGLYHSSIISIRFRLSLSTMVMTLRLGYTSPFFWSPSRIRCSNSRVQSLIGLFCRSWLMLNIVSFSILSKQQNISSSQLGYWVTCIIRLSIHTVMSGCWKVLLLN